ncbi:MAG: DUF4189 domain-containing protein [Betaproteobacteria bacterium]|nr:DUF4189 domain-containing protein [Betaproteobacteria bacterium]
MKTKLILAVFLAVAAAVFPQSALAYAAVWKYGGNWGHGKGVGAVANYKTQKEADRAALKQCEEKRPHWAKKNTKYGCVVVERFQNKCAGYGRYAIAGRWNEKKPGRGWVDRQEVHSSAIFYFVEKYGYSEDSVFAGGSLKETKQYFQDFIKYNVCRRYHNKASGTGYSDNVDPNYHKKYDGRDDIQFSWNDLNCQKPTYTGAVCDAVGYEINFTGAPRK